MCKRAIRSASVLVCHVPFRLASFVHEQRKERDAQQIGKGCTGYQRYRHPSVKRKKGFTGANIPQKASAFG